MQEANRFLRDVFLPAHNRRFAVTPSAHGEAFVPFAGELHDILCVHEERVVGRDNTVRRLSDLLCMSNLVHASPMKEHDDNDDFQGTTGRVA